ncbi:MAG: hypothetical protein HQL69_17465 [Magnetococcales bacterium]|nr:hypothetical protein [Magnetococcales bacterium]
MDLAIYTSWKTWTGARSDLINVLPDQSLSALDQAVDFAISRHGDQIRPTGKSTHFPYRVILEKGLPQEEPDPMDFF